VKSDLTSLFKFLYHHIYNDIHVHNYSYFIILHCTNDINVTSCQPSWDNPVEKWTQPVSYPLFILHDQCRWRANELKLGLLNQFSIIYFDSYSGTLITLWVKLLIWLFLYEPIILFGVAVKSVMWSSVNLTIWFDIIN